MADKTPAASTAKRDDEAPKATAEDAPKVKASAPVAGLPAKGRTMCPNCGFHVETA